MGKMGEHATPKWGTRREREKIIISINVVIKVYLGRPIWDGSTLSGEK